MVRINVCRFLGSGGRPIGRDFQRQNSRKPARCQRTNVLDCTMVSAGAHGKNLLKTTSASLAAVLVDADESSFPGTGQVASVRTDSLQ